MCWSGAIPCVVINSMEMCPAFRWKLNWSCKVFYKFIFYVCVSLDNIYWSAVGQICCFFTRRKLNILRYREEATGDASAGCRLVVPDHLQDEVKQSLPFFLLYLHAVHALAGGDEQNNHTQYYVPSLLSPHGFQARLCIGGCFCLQWRVRKVVREK